MSEQRKEYKIDGRPSTIYRVVKNKDNPYVMIDRRPVDNPSLSYKAKGILTYLMSRPDGWEVSVIDLINHGADGEASVRSGLKELRDAGHMRYTQSRNQGRITGWLIEVFEVPLSPDRDFLKVEIQDVENRTQVLSNLSNKQNQEEEATDPKNIYQLYSEEIGVITPSIADALKDWENDVPEKWIKDAILEASASGARNWKYVQAILKRWHEQGHQGENKPAKKKGKKSQSPNPLVPVELSEQELEKLRKYAEQEMGA